MKEPSPLRSKILELADWFEEQDDRGFKSKWVDLRGYSLIDQQKIQRNLRKEFRKRGKYYQVSHLGMYLQIRVRHSKP